MPRLREDTKANEEVKRRMTATEILENERRQKELAYDNKLRARAFLNGGPLGLATLASVLDHRAELTSHFARVGDMSYKEARELAKIVTYAEIYGTSRERLKELLMKNSTITLDAGDRYMMKQMGMDEEQYEQFIFDILLEKYNLYQPVPPGTYTGKLKEPIRGKHFDQIILDDIQKREEDTVNQQGAAAQAQTDCRPIGRPLGLGAPYSVEGTETGRIRQINPAGPQDARREAVNEAFGSLMAAQDEAMKQRAAVRSSDPLQPDFAEMLLELHRRNQYYMSALQRYLDVSAFSTPMQAQAAGPR